MKINVTRNEPKPAWEPMTITITFDTKREAELFMAAAGNDIALARYLVKNNVVFAKDQTQVQGIFTKIYRAMYNKDSSLFCYYDMCSNKGYRK